MTQRVSQVLKRLKPGQVLTAQDISDLQRGLNGLQGGVNSPKNDSTVYGEVARTVKDVEVDSSGPTITFQQIQSVTLKNGAGDVIVLQFNNPDLTTP